MGETFVSKETLDELQTLGAATVYEAQGARGALPSAFKPLHPSMRLAGPALTVDTRPADNLMIHYALLKAKPGDVLVVDAKAFIEAGVWGDVLTQQALHIGLAGLVVNGAVRDAATIIDMGFPVFCRGLSIKGTGKNQPGKVNVPVHMGDALVHPGDILVGDQDGLVVVRPAEAAETLRLARAREEKETHFRDAIKQGATTADLLKLGETLRAFDLV